jgi:hypothetical protein
MASLASSAKLFRNIYKTPLATLKAQKEYAKFLNTFKYGMIHRSPSEYRPRTYKPRPNANGRIVIGPTSAYKTARELVRLGSESPFVTNRNRQLKARMNQRNKDLARIKHSQKSGYMKVANANQPGFFSISFYTTPNHKRYVWHSNKRLSGLNLGVPNRNIKLGNIFTKLNRRKLG